MGGEVSLWKRMRSLFRLCASLGEPWISGNKAKSLAGRSILATAGVTASLGAESLHLQLESGLAVLVEAGGSARFSQQDFVAMGSAGALCMPHVLPHSCAEQIIRLREAPEVPTSTRLARSRPKILRVPIRRTARILTHAPE